MTVSLIVAASLLRFLDPFTSVYQTDDAAEGAVLASEPGYWPVPQGLVDPCAEWGKWKPRVVHAVFRVSDEPFAEYDPDRPSPLFKVNQVGYLPNAPKFAYVGAWLGPVLGAWKPRWSQGSGVWGLELGVSSQGSGVSSQGKSWSSELELEVGVRGQESGVRSQ